MKMKVAVRIRPALNPDNRICISTDKSTVSIFNRENIAENITYEFPTLFDVNSLQKDVYNDLIQPEIKHILEGQNVSIFAYGGTGSGKTHTILGSPSDPGIISRLIQDLLDAFYCQTDHSYKLTLSYLELYNEKVLFGCYSHNVLVDVTSDLLQIRDLINDKNEDLAIRQDVHQNVFVPNLTEKEVESFQDFSKIFGATSEIGSNSKSKTSSHINSSHSHGIVLLKVIRSELNSSKRHISKVFLVDLASAEKYDSTGNEGTRCKEINKSLSAFIDVIAAINHGNRHIPFRNGKLTRLLQNSLSGSSHIVMIANVAPEEEHYHNTYCTLNFASEHKKFVENPTFNELATAYNIKLPKSKQKQEKSQKEKTKLITDSVSDKSKSHSARATLIKNIPTLIDDLKCKLLNMKESLPTRPSSKTKVSPKLQKPKVLHKTFKKDTETKFNAIIKDCAASENKETKHRAQVLQLLNSQSENDLLLLHTVGKRRAQLIIKWTQNQGSFQQIEDLLQIPELGQKYLTQFLYHNHLTDVNKENL